MRRVPPTLFGRRPHNASSLVGCVLLIVAVATACRPGVAEDLLVERENPWIGDQSKCSVRHSLSSPLVVEWPAADRGSLERRLKRGVAVVRYEGCAMEVLRRCTVPDSSYHYGGFTRKTEEVRMQDADELYAHLPVGAAKLEAKLENSDALTVSMTMVGMYEADRDVIRIDELRGHCEGATHFLSGVQVGAYSFDSEREIEVAGAAGLRGGPELKAGSRVERENLSRDGDTSRCEASDPSDAEPPQGCGALIRLEVVPLGEARRQIAPRPQTALTPGTCGPGMAMIPGGGRESLRDFCLDLTEVTAGEYTRCVEAGACAQPSPSVWFRDMPEEARVAGTELCNGTAADRSDHPMNCVTWAQAQLFCRHHGARLPRDAEWRWAAAGGEDGRTYPWGEQAPSPAHTNACGVECRAWFERRGERRPRVAFAGDDGWPATAAVGSFPAGRSRWGPLDLAGNVAEWTADRAERRPSRRVRGGSFWVQRPASLRNDDNAAANPDRRDAVIGFRCADDV